MTEKLKDIELFDLHALPCEMKDELISGISKFTYTLLNTEKQIIPMNRDQVLAKHVAKVALAGREELAGFAGALNVGQHRLLKMSKVGSLFVLPDFTGQGLGLQLINEVTKEVLDQNRYPFAFCNPSVEHLFHAASYIPARQTEIPDDQVSHFPHRNRPWIYYNGVPSYMYPIWMKKPYAQAEF